MSDVLLGLAHLIKHSNFQLPSLKGVGGTDSTPLGKPFEVYCKDWLSLLLPGNVNQRLNFYDQAFSYQGADNNPPDVMYRGGNAGDAFEFKKTESATAALPLNSSYPKDCLTNTSPGLLSVCINCEPWTKRTFYYVIGRVKKGDQRVSSLWVVDGRLMASKHSDYIKVFTGLQVVVDAFITSQKLHKIDSVELGRIRTIDPLDKTVLRVRSMWELESPQKTFAKVEGVKPDKKKAVLHALILDSSWENYSAQSKTAITSLVGREGFALTNVTNIPDPSNPQKILSAKLIRYES